MKIWILVMAMTNGYPVGPPGDGHREYYLAAEYCAGALDKIENITAKQYSRCVEFSEVSK
jgi:hypothetical protein